MDYFFCQFLSERQNGLPSTSGSCFYIERLSQVGIGWLSPCALLSFSPVSVLEMTVLAQARGVLGP